MDEKILAKIKGLLALYGCDEHEIENFMKDLVEEKEEQADEVEEHVEEDLEDDEEEYNAQANVESILGKDFDLEKDKELKDLIAKKYAR